ncbi:MAG TPA: menaquinone biosynthesis protein [Terracidiphilus sp.]|nr:menaquinone biosynthesis protein [Terracidiphilus sp.]
MSQQAKERLRIAAIGFLNPAPLMWDFEHPPRDADLARRYRIDRMTPAECAERLANGAADIGLVPIAALAANPSLRILPGCTIASKGRVRSLLLVRRASQPLAALRSVAADIASRTTIAYARILFHKWGNPDVPFVPMAADLDRMLERTDAAIVIGDPALLALEERSNRFERTGEPLIYHDLAEEWQSVTGLPFVSAVWGAAAKSAVDEQVIDDLNQSRIHGHENLDRLIVEWSNRLPISEQVISDYLSFNIQYILDEECVEGMRGFFRLAAELGILPAYTPSLEEPVIL